MIILLSQKEHIMGLSDNTKNLDLLKSDLSLVEIGHCYEKNELSIYSLCDKQHKIRSSFL
jgi:hypothetical protein